MNFAGIRMPVTVLLVGLATACSSPPTNEEVGRVVGGVVGVALGTQIGSGTGRTIATVAGGAVGGMVGGSIGRGMDESDRSRVRHALEYNPTGRASHWRNPDSGNEYTVTPTATDAAGPCRDYTTEALIDGRRDQVSGTACRAADGSWQARN